MLNEEYILTSKEIDDIDLTPLSLLPETFHNHKICSFMNNRAKTSTKPNEVKLYTFLGLIFSFSLRVVSGKPDYEPQAIFGDKRSLLPEDCTENIVQYLYLLSEKIKNPFLTSRIFDVIWLKKKSAGDVGIKAIEAYSEMISITVEKVKHLDPQQEGYDVSQLIFIKDYIARALFLSSCIYPRKSGGNMQIKAAIESLYQIQNERQIFEGFDYLTGRMLSISSKDKWLGYATNAEAIARAHSGKVYFEAVKALYLTASSIYEKCSEPEKAKLCKLAAAQITISYADSLDEPNIKSNWLRVAIAELRAYGGSSKDIAKLKAELASVREEAMSSFFTHSVPIDISNEVNNTLDVLNGRPIDYIFRYVLENIIIDNIDEIKEYAQRNVSESFFSSFASTALFDEDGRLSYRSKPIQDLANIGDDEAIDNYLLHIQTHHDIYVATVFEPARHVIAQHHNLSLNTFIKLTAYTPVLKQECKEVVSLGFYRLWQGDYMGACYMLIPQMESILRHVFDISGKDPTHYDNKGLEESTSISILLNNYREELETLFSKDLILTIDLVFNRKNGPKLRHKLAHGNFYTGLCFSGSAIYACVLIFYICAYPLHDHFDKIFDVDKLDPMK